MTKRELIDEVMKLYPRFSRRDAEVMVNAVFESMTEALSRDERIEVRGFGSFVIKHRQAREGRNPKTGELVSVAAKRLPFFKVGKELKLRVDGRPVPDSDDGDSSVGGGEEFQEG
jgi:integration host factor subunit beta